MCATNTGGDMYARHRLGKFSNSETGEVTARAEASEDNGRV